ncbi:hypothetical protein F4814DRAFT_439631 [Daldinia grandis]|nr:hypothetical protein F4814DRAFT_439631 [Daldinia grandis]
MDALLESTRGNLVCSSVQDIQDRLHRLLASRSSDTRAEHASFTFELRHNVVFHLSPDAENAPPDGVIDPTEQSHHQPITQSVNAFETVQNQPSDDPILQRAVAKHIVGAMGTVDNSSWTVRKVSRDSQGWTFTYICKDSLQAWNRANAKNVEKHVIGSYSGPGSLDPINASRPAFDCRGTLTIAFSKFSRGVIVKYDHTPIHKTVAQLVDLIAPDLPPPPVNNGGTGSQRTPRAKRPPPAQGEEGSRKKRSRKKEKAPEAPMGGPPPGDGQNSQNNALPQDVDHSGVHATLIPHVPPDEVERRRRTAIDLLNGRRVDPATLSGEQFNIFANQSPYLQEKSLALLVEHGADKLRIVLSDDKNADSTPIEEQPTSTAPAPVTELGQASTPGTAETPTKKRRSRKRKYDGIVAEVSIGDGAVVPVHQNGEIGTTTSTLKLTTKKTRGSCETCRNRKLKCTKEHPNCSVCTAAEVECVYLPPKPRRKRAGISAEVVENEDSDLPGEREEFQAQMQSQEAPLPTPTTQMPVQYQAPATTPPIPDPDNEEFIPDPNILSGLVEHPPATAQPSTTQYYHNHTNTLTFPQNPQPPTESTAISAITFPESQARETQSESPNLVFSSTSHQTERPSGLTFPQQVPATSQKGQSTRMSNRRSLPTTQTKQRPIPTPVPPPTMPHHVLDWNPPSTAGHATTASPALSQQQTSRQSKARKSDAEVRQQTNDNVRQPPVISQVTAQSQRQPSPATGSPYQAAARAKSRQDNRSQTNTPVASISHPPPQAPQAAVNASYNTTASASITSYDPYPRYDNTDNSQYNNTSNDQGSARIAYEPGSYHSHTAAISSASYSSAPAYDYPRTTSSSNPLSQALSSSSGYNNTSSSTVAQWPTSQTRGSQAHAQPQASNTYPMASTTASSSNNYGTSSAESRTTHQNTPYTQPQSQSYNSYAAQQPSTNQQPQQSWYGFNANNNSSVGSGQNSYSSNRNSGYGGTTSSNQAAYTSSHRSSNISNYPAHNYGSGSDDQSIYELLRATGPSH